MYMNGGLRVKLARFRKNDFNICHQMRVQCSATCLASPRSRFSFSSAVRRKWSTDRIHIKNVCACGCLPVHYPACVYLSYRSSLEVPAARPVLINRMPCWGNSVLGFNLCGTLGNHQASPPTWSSPTLHRGAELTSRHVASGPTAGTSAIIALTVGLIMNGHLMALPAERN